MGKKLPKKPKAKKLPKKPKASASLSSWEKYNERHAAAIKHNSTSLSDWKKKCDSIKRDEQKRQALIKKFSR